MKLLSLEPESSASANSAIPAKERKNGGRGWIRTIEVCDGRFTVCSLWPLGNPAVIKLPRYFGAGDRNRTCNLLITNQLLCQLSYTSIPIGMSKEKNGDAEGARTLDLQRDRLAF